MPEVYALVLNDDDMAIINDVRKIYNLIYKGPDEFLSHILDLKKV